MVRDTRYTDCRRRIAKYIAYNIMDDGEHFKADAETRKFYRNQADYILQIVSNCCLLRNTGKGW